MREPIRVLEVAEVGDTVSAFRIGEIGRGIETKNPRNEER